MTQPSNTRRQRALDKQMKQQIVFSLVGIVVIIFLIFKFGVVVIQYIGNVATSLQKPQNASYSSSPSAVVLRAPELGNIPNATKDPTVKVTGIVSDTSGTVQIYVNNNLAKTASVQGNGSFEADNIPLQAGANTISANYTKDGKTSDSTPVYTITYYTSAPSLSITFPTDKQQFGRGDEEITVQGKTDPNALVMVNGYQAIVDNNGNFTYYLKLANGDNTISVEADNAAGLSTKQQITVNYHS